MRTALRWLNAGNTAAVGLPACRMLSKRSTLGVYLPIFQHGPSRSSVRPGQRPSLLMGAAVGVQRVAPAKLAKPVQKELVDPQRNPLSSPLDNLNQQQRAATLTTALVVRVKAGPGSGKTRVVVARTLHLIQDCGVHPSRILVITFTNKAAAELKERLAAALGTGAAAVSTTSSDDSSDPGATGKSEAATAPPQVLAKTFHGLGALMLRKSLKHVPSFVVDRRFKIVDAEQSQKLSMKAIEQVEEQIEKIRQEQAGAAAGAADPAALSRQPLTRTDKETLATKLANILADIKSQLAHVGYYDVEGAVVKAVEGSNHIAGVLPAKPREPKMRNGISVESPAVAFRWYQKRVQVYYSAYERLLRCDNAVDFADLICLPVRLLERHPEVAEEQWRSRFSHVLVDEFQDTDPAQYRLVKLLRAPATSLFIVGDPDQAIYGWRGAKVTNMTNTFGKDFPDSETHSLPVNYRSVPDILAAADAVLCSGRAPELYTEQVATRPASGSALHLHTYDSPKEEAAGVVARIRSWVSAGELGRGTVPRWKDLAVLYRTRDQSRPLEEQLVRAGMPLTVLGGMPFWQYKEVCDVVAYLHLMLDPLRSDLCLERVINEPKRNIGDKKLAALRQAAKEAGGITLGALLFGDCVDGVIAASAAAGRQQQPQQDAAAFAPDIPADSPLSTVKLDKAARHGVQTLRGLVRRVRSLAAGGAPAHTLVAEVLELSGYRAALELQAQEGRGKSTSNKNKDVSQVAEERLVRLQTMCDVAQRPGDWVVADELREEEEGSEDEEETAGGSPRRGSNRSRLDTGLSGLRRFLEHAALVTGLDPVTADDGNSIRLMTLHASKGLEFKRVFILGVEEGLIPAGFSKDKEEERRLFYVGLTRGKDQVWLSHCRTRFQFGRTLGYQRSSFLTPLQGLLRS